MSEFMPEPSIVLPDMEAVRQVCAANMRDSAAWIVGRTAWQVKSLWIIGLIDEIIAEKKARAKPIRENNSGIIVISLFGDDAFAYNSEVKKLAEQRLGFPPKPEAEYSREGDTLSLLVYNAQGYRRSDQLRADGFVPLEQSLINSLGVGGKFRDKGGNEYTVRDVQGTLYAMQPRKKKYAASPQGQPVKVV